MCVFQTELSKGQTLDSFRVKNNQKTNYVISKVTSKPHFCFSLLSLLCNCLNIENL